MDDYILKAENIELSFGNTFSISGFSVNMERGKVYGLLGPTGSGKTTVIKVLAGKIKAYSGNIVYRGRYYKDAVGKVKPSIVYVPQEAPDSLDRIRTVREQTEKIMRQHSLEFSRDGLRRIFEDLGTDASIIDKKPDELSQGEKHTAVLAMAISLSPDIILMDEPSTSLDAKEMLALAGMIKRNALDGTSFLISGTSPEFATYVSDYIYIMLCGQIIESGRKEDVAMRPGHPYTRMMMLRPSIENRNSGIHRFMHKCTVGSCRFMEYCPSREARCASEIEMACGMDHCVRCVLWKGQ